MANSSDLTVLYHNMPYFVNLFYKKRKWVSNLLMNFNELLSLQRKERGMSQNEFYNHIISRPSANSFEQDDSNVIKLGFLPELTAKIDMSVKEAIDFCNENFLNELDLAVKRLQTVINDYKQKSDLDSKNNVNNFYSEVLKKKQSSLFYFNIYLILQGNIDFLDGVTKSDLLELKKIIKKRSIITSIDYKILANMLVFFSDKKLDFYMDKLFPLEENLTFEAVDSAYKVVNNLCSVNFQKKNFDATERYLKMFQEVLIKYPSYKYTLLYEHSRYLLRFFRSEEITDFNSAFSMIDIIEKCEGKNSTYAPNLRKNMLELIKSEGKGHLITGGIVYTNISNKSVGSEGLEYIDKPFFD